VRRTRARFALTLLPLAVLATALPAVFGQEEEPPVESGLVERERVAVRVVDFLVVDRGGRPVTDLRREEVELRDGGEMQTILDFLPAHFRGPAAAGLVDGGVGDSGKTATAATEPGGESEPEEAPPAVARRWIVFLFDVRNLSYSGRSHAGEAALELVEEHLGPQDRVSLMVDEDDLKVLVPFTTRREALLHHLKNPEGMSKRYRDIERRLEDLRDDTESCRDVSNLVNCATQAATNYVMETSRETEASLEHLEALLHSLAAIPDRKLVFYISEGFVIDPGDVASAAVEHAIGQFGYNVNMSRSFLSRDYRHRLDRIYALASRARAGLYVVNTIRKMTDDLFSPERATEFGPENLPQARTDPFEATWQQVHKVHRQMARATGAVPVFRRDPGSLLADQLRSSDGVYTLTYTPTHFSWGRRKIKIDVSRRKVKVLYRSRYNLVADDTRRLGGKLTVAADEADPSGGLVRAKLSVPGAEFALAPDAKPPVSVAAFFFEITDAQLRPVTDLFELIAFPRPDEEAPGHQMLERPFALRVPPGEYTLRVDVTDVNGPSRGSFSETFRVGGAAGGEAVETPAEDSSAAPPSGP